MVEHRDGYRALLTKNEADLFKENTKRYSIDESDTEQIKAADLRIAHLQNEKRSLEASIQALDTLSTGEHFQELKYKIS